QVAPTEITSETTSIDVSLNATDDLGIKKLTLQLRDATSLYKTQQMIRGIDGLWTVTIDISSIQLADISELYLYIIAEDHAGNLETSLIHTYTLNSDSNMESAPVPSFTALLVLFSLGVFILIKKFRK
ncbi:MAG: hypothetical protein ACFFBD_25410, partial [Candidatus Hodarchaeota archaeon]